MWWGSEAGDAAEDCLFRHACGFSMIVCPSLTKWLATVFLKSFPLPCRTRSLRTSCSGGLSSQKSSSFRADDLVALRGLLETLEHFLDWFASVHLFPLSTT